jgi:dolichol-phosphate mannosyltransferase
MTRTLVIIPTYNEKANIRSVTDSVLKNDGCDVLVVDDNSPDGTAEVALKMIAFGKRVFLVQRSGKLGLGTVYVEGFRWGLSKGYDYLVEMDADGLHDPEALPTFIGEMEKGRGLVIGSRYLKRAISVVGWDFYRLMLSKLGNFYASRILGMRQTDLTNGSGATLGTHLGLSTWTSFIPQGTGSR